MNVRSSNYDKFPFVAVSSADGACVAGWPAIAGRLRAAVEAVRARGRARMIVVMECYPGVDETDVRAQLTRLLDPTLVVHTADAMKSDVEIERLCEPFLGGDDPVFGYICDITLPQFFDEAKTAALAHRIAVVERGLVLIVGTGARLIAEGDILVYADLARWEIQQRQRRNEIGNLGVSNAAAAAAVKYKRAFFIDWRVADRWKKPWFKRADFFLDTTNPREPKLAEGAAVRRGFAEAVTRPFRVVPFFDPGPWGGQWMKQVCGLNGAAPNYAWCFDCVPEENSIVLGLGPHRFELPAIDLVFAEPRALLGEAVHARFGEEFPIRFDLLDTMGGGNLSLQVHPRANYIRQKFGLSYTQDESYYLLDAAPDATVYLGLREGVDRERMLRELQSAQAGGEPFMPERHVNRLPVKRHDHVLIPAGTIHCSGRNSVVLEISATPYIFTFKLWDWGRLGLDGKPRPIHLDHGAANIAWERTTGWVRNELINRVAPLGHGAGWREERTGLHESEFIETRRHWFKRYVDHDTGGAANGGVHVLNLVQGEEAVVESPDGAFAPFRVHYAETWIVPAAVGRYTIRPNGPGDGSECATLKAFVR